MSKSETKTQPELPVVAADGSWPWECAGRRYRMREADIDQLRMSNMGQDQSILLPLVTEEDVGDGKWKQFEWPKGGVHRLFQSLGLGYMLGLASVEAQLKKSLTPTNGKTSPMQKQEELIRP